MFLYALNLTTTTIVYHQIILKHDKENKDVRAMTGCVIQNSQRHQVLLRGTPCENDQNTHFYIYFTNK